MNLSDWQQRFEAWLHQHYQHQDAAHDIGHFRRVWLTAGRLSDGQPVDLLVVLTACYFHDIVSLAKNHPQRHLSSQMAAEKTREILTADFADFPAESIPGVLHAISAHSYSAGITPESLEAKIVQDADRLEALGAIGLARVFAVGGALNLALFDPEDPFAGQRELNDRQYSLDHFQSKLLRLPDSMQTARGREMARDSARFLVQFMARLGAELVGDYSGIDERIVQRFAPQS